jgi:hypothetical protein
VQAITKEKVKVDLQRSGKSVVAGRPSSVGESQRDLSRARRARLDVRRVKVWLLGDRGYPERLVKLREERVRDLPDLIVAAQQLNPAVTVDAVVHAIWRLGSYRLHQNLLRRIPVKVSDLPKCPTPGS